MQLGSATTLLFKVKAGHYPPDKKPVFFIMKQLCINLDDRPDRWEQAQVEFKKWWLNVERLSAVKHDNRPLAFNQSVYKAMKLAEGESLLLFEDDVVITGDFYLPPTEALTVHYGCNIFGVDTTVWQMPTPYNEYAAKLHNCYQSHATYYSAECVSFILRNLDPSVLNEDNNIFDDWLRRKVLSQGRSFVTKPMVCYQRPSFSDIWNCEADYTGCHYRGNEWLKLNT